MQNRIALCVVFTLAGCGVNEKNRAQNQAGESFEAKREFVVGSSELGLSSPSMYASHNHVFNFDSKKDVSSNAVSEGMWARVISGQTTDKTCQKGVLDPQGKLYTFYFGRFVNSSTKQTIPFETKVDIFNNLSASGVHAGQIFVSAVNSFYDKYGSAVVQVQFCANNVMKQGFVRSFKVTLTPITPSPTPPTAAPIAAPIAAPTARPTAGPTAPSSASLSASVCLPNRDNPKMCTSFISWENAPEKSCIYVEGKPSPFACGGKETTFGGKGTNFEAPWINYSNPAATKFVLRDKENASLVYASLTPVKPSLSASVCLPNRDNPVLCTSFISWENAPEKSCIFVEGKPSPFACGGKETTFGGKGTNFEAPWINYSNPAATKFVLRDKENASLVYASLTPVKPSLSASVCLPNIDTPVLCISRISWENAPPNSCVFVRGNPSPFACGGRSGSQVAPWIGASNPEDTVFILRDKVDSSRVYSSVSSRNQ